MTCLALQNDRQNLCFVRDIYVVCKKWPEMVIKCAELLTIVTTRLGETVFSIGKFCMIGSKRLKYMNVLFIYHNILIIWFCILINIVFNILIQFKLFYGLLGRSTASIVRPICLVKLNSTKNMFGNIYFLYICTKFHVAKNSFSTNP